ncbi:Beta-lactam-inducible penicillin-binding protein [Bacillus sp. THAF10]|uniref:penicillin-binding transpeptidase domain-containing protein n=1 Tax=Bacillus sp. THAF10 TaxID=2587848 RepID=UPI00126919D1|nr:penicillin-binding transpeptidase domain-containing protein [Bacillus sp. THAF10]QFT89129.1 Beta-lactam-inducible penicillin-binding protein [Bacillus sp. THAF10]
MKRLLFIFTALAILSGCQKEPVNPYDVLNKYITSWTEKDYEKMHQEFLQPSDKEQVSLKLFKEKHLEVYDFFQMENLTIEILDKEILWEEKESVTIPAKISYDTFARKVDYEVEFVLAKTIDEEENEHWHLDWDPTFIFPDYALTDTFKVAYSPAPRGEIFDKEGRLLAGDEELILLGIIPGKFDAETDLTRLAEHINLTEEDITKLYTVSWAQPDQLMVIKKFREEQREHVLEIIDFEKGIWNNREVQRVYPYAEATAHLVGYIDEVTAQDLEENDEYEAGDRVGKAGMEALYEEQLKGTEGMLVTQVKEDGTEKTVARTEPVRGEDITLTIDAEIQAKLYETIKDETGQATVYEPSTGKVLSLVSVPAYDPNSVTIGPRNNATLNTFRYTYSPGSTMKLLTAIIGLESGKLDPNHQYDIPKKQWNIGGSNVTRVYEDDKKVDLRSGLNNSDNIYFAMAGVEIGAETFEEGLRKLGVGEELPFAYPIESNSQISNSGKFNSNVMLAHTAYGQGEFLISLVHLASIYGGIVNDGTMMKPLLLKEEESSVWKEIASSDTAALLKGLLRQTVTEGKSSVANLPGREIAGKTGTAEIDKTKGMENGLWISYDQKNPTLLTAMLIEDVLEKGGSKHTIELTNKFYGALSN